MPSGHSDHLPKSHDADKAIDPKVASAKARAEAAKTTARAKKLEAKKARQREDKRGKK